MIFDTSLPGSASCCSALGVGVSAGDTSSPRSAPASVLLAEDNRDLQQIFARQLTFLGLEVLAVTNGRDAADYALANFAFLPYYPLWTILVIAFYVLVIWALTAQLRNE